MSGVEANSEHWLCNCNQTFFNVLHCLFFTGIPIICIYMEGNEYILITSGWFTWEPSCQVYESFDSTLNKRGNCFIKIFVNVALFDNCFCTAKAMSFLMWPRLVGVGTTRCFWIKKYMGPGHVKKKMFYCIKEGMFYWWKRCYIEVGSKVTCAFVSSQNDVKWILRWFWISNVWWKCIIFCVFISINFWWYWNVPKAVTWSTPCSFHDCFIVFYNC